MAVYALTGGTFIVAGVVIVTVLAVIYGTFTYRGSGISPHGGDQTGDAPGAADPSNPAGEGRTNDGGAFSTHGTNQVAAARQPISLVIHNERDEDTHGPPRPAILANDPVSWTSTFFMQFATRRGDQKCLTTTPPPPLLRRG